MGGLDPFAVVNEDHAAFGDDAPTINGKRAILDFSAVVQEVAADAELEAGVVELAEFSGQRGKRVADGFAEAAGILGSMVTERCLQKYGACARR